MVEVKNVMVIMLIGIVLLALVSIDPGIALSVAIGIDMEIDMPVIPLVTVAMLMESIGENRRGFLDEVALKDEK